VSLSKEEQEKKQAVDAIKEMGFDTEEKIIAALYDKYKKVDIVAAVLAEARLSESAFEVVSKATNWPEKNIEPYLCSLYLIE